jgi:hypothetical protein
MQPCHRCAHATNQNDPGWEISSTFRGGSRSGVSPLLVVLTVQAREGFAICAELERSIALLSYSGSVGAALLPGAFERVALVVMVVIG